MHRVSMYTGHFKTFEKRSDLFRVRNHVPGVVQRYPTATEAFDEFSPHGLSGTSALSGRSETAVRHHVAHDRLPPASRSLWPTAKSTAVTIL